MRCAICLAKPLTESELQCPACARAALYPLRIQYAKVLLERERFSQEAESTIHDAEARGDHSASPGDNTAARKLEFEQDVAQLAETKAKLQQITEHSSRLREQSDQSRASIAQRRTVMCQRQRSLAAKRAELETSYVHEVKPLRPTMKNIRSTLDAISREMHGFRAIRCRVAASLAGLQRTPRKTPSGVHYDYSIGGTSLMNLRQISSKDPQEVSACLGNVARLLSLSCSYLQVRLPSELILPHRDRPSPVIMSLASSHRTVSFLSPPNSSSQSLKTSPKSSRDLEQAGFGRPRSLVLDRKLPRLSKEVPSTYNQFAEAVALLAWNVIWLSRMQGLPIASASWEEACDIGRNLWKVLVEAPSALARRRDNGSKQQGILPDRGPTQVSISSLPLTIPSAPQPAPQEVSVGQWKLARPSKLINELKLMLLADMSGHDWELLDGEGLEEDGNVSVKDAEEGVFVGGDSRRDSGVGELGERRIKGSNGWTKIRGRPV